MLRLALSLLSSLQIGYRLKEAAVTSLREVAVLAIAGLLLLAAATFGLVASYHALVAHGFAPFEAAALVAMSLTVLALLILLVGPRLVQKSAEHREHIVPSLPAVSNPIDQGLSKLMRKLGPLTFLSIAFVGGLVAGRRT
jgi:hypothetical protein